MGDLIKEEVKGKTRQERRKKRRASHARAYEEQLLPFTDAMGKRPIHRSKYRGQKRGQQRRS